jgi:hypothetical protein
MKEMYQSPIFLSLLKPIYVIVKVVAVSTAEADKAFSFMTKLRIFLI